MAAHFVMTHIGKVTLTKPYPPHKKCSAVVILVLALHIYSASQLWVSANINCSDAKYTILTVYLQPCFTTKLESI